MLPCKDHGKAGNAHGYASAYYQGKYTMRHRKAFCIANGVNLADLVGVVRHTCDNKRCEEPTHLLLGTHADNIADTCGKAGSQVKTRVLSDAEVAEVRRLFTLGATRNELTTRYGVKYQTIKQIILGTRR